MILLTATTVQGQINISGKVFGGARQANVEGHAYVSIGAEKHDVVINAVYGGNDISGTIGSSTKPIGVDNGNHITGLDNYNSFVRTDKESDGKHLFIGQLFGGGYGNYDYKNGTESGKYKVSLTYTVWDPSLNGGAGGYDHNHPATLLNIDKPEIDRTYVDLHGGTVGYVFGGGDNVTVKEVTNICINNTSTRTRTATEDGGLALLTTQRLQDMGINTEYFNKIDNHITGDDKIDKFLFSRVFGGNNKADMRAMPKWHLQAGSIENLYSGGNEGRMTSPQGVLLEIGSNTEPSEINVYNVYGGCRKADVRPLNSDGSDVTHVYNIEGYNFPAEFAARVVVHSGKVHNVYGGNDVRGRVYFGNAVGIRTNISGDIYGGGNGSYPYTDNADLANDLIYGDFYYNPIEELGLKDGDGNPKTTFTQLESAQALNLVRPNAEQVSIRIADPNVTDTSGPITTPPVIIGGSVYCGGNSATLKMDPAHSNISNNYPVVELKIGSNIIIDKVFLGNNGANMVDQSAGGLLEQYHGNVPPAAGGDPVDFSTLDLTDSDIFKEYMKGCAMDIIPSVNFDSRELNQDAATYRDYSAYIGSFYCGGNVGSMTYNDVKAMNFNRKFIIFDKLVAGCNNAVVPQKTDVNALYEGGLIGNPNSTSGNKVELILSGIKIEPKRWKMKTENGERVYDLDANGNRQLEWNTIYASTGEETPAITQALTSSDLENGTDYHLSDDYDLDRRFQHGHIYGGCYSSGIVNGNVVINIDGHLIEREKLFDVVKTDNLGEEESLYGDDQTRQERFKITERKTGVLLAQQGMDVLGAALNVFGGGKGKATEIWGSTTINLNRGYTFQIFGGSEEGVIGKPDDGTGTGDAYTYSYDLPFIGAEGSQTITKTYKYQQKYSCYVNLCGANAGVSKKADQSEDMAECEFMYGGGFFGPICGNTYVNLGKGRIFNSFAGSCNADILGHTETYIGRMVKAGPQNNPYQYKNVLSSHADEASYYEEGFPWIRDYTYGGNDLGGLIKQQVDFSAKVRNADIRAMVYRDNVSSVLTANAYTEYLQGRAEGIFGGCYGTYDYTNSKFKDYFYTTGGTGTTTENIGTARPGNNKPYIPSAFVNFRPTYSQSNNLVNKIYGAGQGYPDEIDRDHLQDYSYVLIDIPQDMTYYKEMEVFGAGAWSGVGMKTILWPNLSPTLDESIELDHHSTIIDLVRGQIGAAYGGSYAEGITRRTVVNVPQGSTITIGSIFGGAYGTKTLPTCDVLDANVEYHSANATLVYDPASSNLYQGSLYGGNNNERRTLSAYVNIDVPVVQRKVIQYDGEIGNMTKGQELMSNGTVYGAGRGQNTWAEYTMVDLKDGAMVWEVYGGGQLGHVLNAQTVQKYMQIYKETPSPDIPASEYTDWDSAWQKAWKMDNFFPNETFDLTNGKFDFDHYAAFIATKLNAARARTELDAKTKALLGGSGSDGTFFNTNVIIRKGATVNNYAYGGGLGKSGVANSGDVWGTTYIALLGGTVKKDLYAAGTSGGVLDAFGVGSYSSTNPLGFTASANAYIQGGTARNVYGGGWEGSVGKHTPVTTTTTVTNDEGEEETITKVDMIAGDTTDDIPGETHVVIGILSADDPADNPEGYGFYKGVPTIQRNAYGGGEGGPVYGTSYLTMNNGYVGYEYKGQSYVEKIEDDTYKDQDGHFVSNSNLYDSGCIFGGGYVDNSSVDFTHVMMYGGHVRNAVFGGGEIAAVGRGSIIPSGTNNSARTLDKIYRPGKTNVELYSGYVHRNVFGGGRGYNNLGETGTLFSDGYVFGQTEVGIHGGEIGTEAGVAKEFGNVFGGGDIGYVYSAYDYEENGVVKVGRGIKSGTRYDDGKEGYYYEHKPGSDGKYDKVADFVTVGGEYVPTEDCKVLIEPHCKVIGSSSVSFDNIFYPKGVTVASVDLKYFNEHSSEYSSVLAGIDAATGKVTAENGIKFSRTYAPGEYVPTFALNTLKNKNDFNTTTQTGDKQKWDALDDFGIIIHNAVFAGGNTSSGSSTVFANTTSVFGNATASIHDVYHRDLITLGTGHTGGLYGDGNLTFVDGYRGLNITNYGTDYYSISKEIDIDTYKALPAREAAYYELKYKCIKACIDKDNTHYHPASNEGGKEIKASSISADDLLTLFLEYDETNKEYVSVKDGTTPILSQNADGKWIPNALYWEESGVLPVYAGRLMNSIQRADFCGVFGSRMVMQGAQDRVPEEVDYTNYTINRVREVSLNQQHSRIASDLALKTGGTSTNPANEDPDNFVDLDKAIHGNYFGIYNIVNYLGALTSDVHFMDNKDRRRTDNTDTATYGPDDDLTKVTATAGAIAYLNEHPIEGVTVSGNTVTVSSYSALAQLKSIEGITVGKLTNQTYYDWKVLHKDERKRNNGTSFNKVALASGVYLELTSEKSTGKDLYEKDWGYITGVVELDLINVQQGIGGGFVYAKNEHRPATYNKKTYATLTALNKDALTRKDFTYAGTEVEWETSGNFIHSTQTIIDDCYNISGRYTGVVKPDGTGAMPAHYWYIKGSVYVYDQYISAYTGAPNAYSETVDMPLTITAASHGSMKLLNVMPNKYAYWNSNGQKLGDDQKLVINDVTYYMNTPISYWDWYKLANSEQGLFVDKTYVVKDSCMLKVGNEDKLYPAGYVMLPDEYDGLATEAAKAANLHVVETGGAAVPAVKLMTKNDADQPVPVTSNDAPVYKSFDFVFRESNNLSHETGYILTYKVNNPTDWDTWYTNANSSTHDKQQTDADGYENGPTYYLSGTGGLLGQRYYDIGNVISKDVYTTYQNVVTNYNSAIPTSEDKKQATFERAWIVTEKVTITDDSGESQQNIGTAISATEAAKAAYSGKAAAAYICTSTIKLSQTEYIYLGTKMTSDEKNTYITNVNKDIQKDILTGKTLEQIAAITKMSDLTSDEQAALTDQLKEELQSLLALKKHMDENIVEAYYCTKAGLYGGNYYQGGINYRALEVFSSMDKADRDKFTFNYDALDLLIDPLYSKKPSGAGLKYAEGEKYQYDSPAGTTDEAIATAEKAEANRAGYSLTRPVNYTATYHGDTGIPYTTDEGTSATATDGTELSRTEFESLVNEQRHYAPIVVKSAGTYYVVNTAFQIGNTPYAVGSVITSEAYNSLNGTSDQSNVTAFTFTDEELEGLEKTYYYCREEYQIGSHPVKSIKGNNTNSYGAGQTVPVGAVISASTPQGSDFFGYISLPNDQKNFTIHGIAPTEVSTLYVSRESDIFDLSTEKIITAIYQYDYEETDTYGNISPVSERHVVNIHITFKSGVPSVEDIKAPEIVLPGTKVGLREPKVTPGAYEVTGGGWELFEKSSDAESHTNGVEYSPVSQPLYWYQNDWYVAYYAKTYLGKTYSNAVKVSVANYHDLKKVMEAKAHHYYVDKPGVQRDSKIYINDYSNDQTGSKNGLDLLKSFFELSVLDNPTVNEETGLITSENFTGHKPLDNHVRAGRNLDFILRTDIDHSGSSWTPIGRDAVEDDPSTEDVNEAVDAECFDGTLHGDGYHLSGLDHSLFAHLCGNVYNLGVSGSFTGGGIADEGDGYVENCWVMTTGSPANTTHAIIGNPTDNAEKQIENCYYLNTNGYQTTPDARPMPAKAFYNGTVAYNLNGFYLHKRYYDNNSSWQSGLSDSQKKSYYYLKPENVGTDDKSEGLYPYTYAFYPLEAATDKKLRGYVEERFADGDFRYSGGSIPDDVEQRMRMVEETDEYGVTVVKPYFAPIWPDDYFFFGQTLSYGYETDRTHQDVPTSYATTNRVYRAPAYFRSYDMGVAHFNANAVFSQSKKGDATKEAYKDMTAIDFTGYNDSDRGYPYLEGWSTWSKTSQKPQSDGMSDTEYAFFPPLLDEGVTTDGLTSFMSQDLTQNLLVYTDAPGGTGVNETPTALQKTANAVSSYLADASYDDHEINSTNHTVKAWDSFAGVLHGHWVQKSGDDYVSYRDHMLVDKQDFNAPIAYTFGDNYRMWHQRLPENYVDLKKGWEAISLPFAAEIVTTNQKGEITHFYNESYDYFDHDISKKDGTSTKVGHEYWLREFTDIKEEVVENTSTTIATANFKYPAVVGDGSVIIDKTVTNTFLWDYYYKGVSHNQNDHNRDIYQEYYSDDSRDYDNYPLLTNGIPYIIGFPGTTYYEFDLSGGFSAGTTAETKPQELEKQTITFASQKGTMIQVSDLETVGVSRDYNGKTYTFKPSYLNMAFEAGSDIYTLNAGGNEYNKVPAAPGQSESAVPDTEVSAFRPYFVSKVTNNNNQGNTRTIVFGNEQQEDQIIEQHGDPTKEELNGGLHIYTRKGKIYVKSSLSFTEDLRVVTPAGVAVATLTVKPGQTVEVQADFSGMYVVHTLDGLYTRKVAVKRE